MPRLGRWSTGRVGARFVDQSTTYPKEITRMGKKATAQPESDETPKMVMRCKFDGSDEVYEIDLLDLTSEEEILVEEAFDKPLTQLWEEGWVTRSATGRVFFAYLARRRKEPTFTYDQAVGFNPEIVRREEAEEEARPTDGPKKTGSPS